MKSMCSPRRLTFAILSCTLPLLLASHAKGESPLKPGDHTRTLRIDGLSRSYLVHVPPQYDPKNRTPVVLVLHGAGTNGQITVPFCGLNKKSDEAGFIAVYPNGTGLAGLMLTWNRRPIATRHAVGSHLR
jgi:polyhydroxybutyrate depolymerase